MLTKLVTTALTFAVPLSAFAAVDVFLKMEDIDGESTESSSSSSTAEVNIQTTTSTTTNVNVSSNGEEERTPTDAAAPVFCTKDLKICPDGTAVSRDPEYNCAFAPCPNIEPVPGALPELPEFTCPEGTRPCPDVQVCARSNSECPSAEPTAKPVPLPTKTSDEGVPPEDQIDPPSMQIDAGPSGTDETKKGNVETEFKVEKGEKMQEEGDPDQPIITGNVPTSETKKVKEIVVVGSTVREEPREFNAIIRNGVVVNEEHLEEFIAYTAQVDENIEEIALNFEKISMNYTQPAKLFGLLRVDMSVQTEVFDTEGEDRVKVKFPWWSMFASHELDDFESTLKEELSSMGEISQAIQRQQQTLQTISNVSKMFHDTSMAIIRKIGG